MATHRNVGAAAPGPLTPATNDEAPAVGTAQGFKGGSTADGGNRSREKLTPRQRRLLVALLRGPVTREQADRIAGASNGPDEVFRLRRRCGLVIPCTRRSARDRDGRRVEPGTYSLTTSDRNRARELLREAGLHA